MKNRLTFISFLFCLGAVSTPVSAKESSCPAPQTFADGFCYPAIELRGKLADTFEVSDCKWLSGMTCRIKYSGRHPLPSEVFFTEYDAKRSMLGKRTRLIYPKLKAGEAGFGTFRIRNAAPARIVLEGVWNGKWVDPY